jgi:asparagine synthase (glutamine-hydrolysing)
MTWCVARAARQAGVPVLLSGAGADELFLGYRRHAWFARYGQWFDTVLYKAMAPLLQKLDARLPTAQEAADPWATYRKTMAAPNNLAHFLGMKSPAAPELPTLPNLLWADTYTYLQHQLLPATDVYSMAHSVEVRVPYLTQELQHIAYIFGEKALLKNGPKTPLKILFAQYGGAAMPKTGFGPTPNQYPNFAEVDDALGLNQASHPVYAHLPYQKVAQWRGQKMPLQARMAFWCLGVQIQVANS